MNCWHCQNTNKCDCMFCGKESASGFIAGECGFCAGRAEQDDLRRYLDHYRIDPRDKQHWIRVGNPRDQQPAHLVFLPLRDMRESKKNKGAA